LVLRIEDHDADRLLALTRSVREAAATSLLLPVQRGIEEGRLHPSQLSFQRLRRASLDLEERAALFGPPSQPAAGPVAVGGASRTTIVLGYHPARFDEATRAACQDLLFEAWLEERRRAASVEWQWGPSPAADEPA
jgi:hypothetical protein